MCPGSIMGNPQYKESTGKRLQDETQELVQRFGRLNTLDDLIRLRAADAVQEPILAYPKSHDAAVEYEYFTGEDLDCMIDHAVSGLVEAGFKPVRCGRDFVLPWLMRDSPRKKRLSLCSPRRIWTWSSHSLLSVALDIQ